MEWLKRMLCWHKFEIEDIWRGHYTCKTDFGEKDVPGAVEKTYFCKRCGKIRRVKNY